MMIGTNVDEMRLLSAGDPHRADLDDDGLRRRLDKVLDDGVDEVIDTVTRARGARGEPTTPSDLWFAIESDRFFRVPSLRVGGCAGRARTADVRLPVRLAVARCSTAGSARVTSSRSRSCSACTTRRTSRAFTGAGPDADALSAQMMQAWIAFARTDDPSTPELAWPRHDPRTRPTMFFAEQSRVEIAPREAERAVVAAHARWL